MIFIDFDECAIPGACSQECINTKGSFKCQCHEGYTLTSDRHTCKALSKFDFIMCGTDVCFMSDIPPIPSYLAQFLSYKI